MGDGFGGALAQRRRARGRARPDRRRRCRGRRFGALVAAADRGRDLVGLRHHREDGQLGEHAEVVEREDVLRLRHRDHDVVVLVRERQRAVATRDFFGDELHERHVDDAVAQVDELVAAAFGQDARQIDGIEVAELHEDLAHQLAAGPLVVERDFELLVGDQAARDHHLADAWHAARPIEPQRLRRRRTLGRVKSPGHGVPQTSPRSMVDDTFRSARFRRS